MGDEQSYQPMTSDSIANHLIDSDDPELIPSWTELYGALQIKDTCFSLYREKLQIGSIRVEEILRNFICLWAVKNGHSAKISKLKSILCKLELNIAAEHLDQFGLDTLIWPRKEDVRHQNSKVSIEEKGFYNLRSNTTYFVGRKKESKLLMELCDSSSKSFLALNGITGCGKTELLYQFANGVFRTSPGICVSFNCESKDIFTSCLQNEFQKLKEIEITNDDFDLLESFKTVTKCFYNKTKGNLLIILDNFSDSNDFSSGLIEVCRNDFQPFRTLFVLVAQQKQCPFNTQTIELPELNMSHATKLFIKNLKVNGQFKNLKSKHAKYLCYQLSLNPLTLMQAIQYINEKLKNDAFFDIIAFIKKFNSKIKQNIFQFSLMLESNKKQNIYDNISKVLKNIEKSHNDGKLTRSLLKYMSLINPDGVEISVLLKIMTNIKDIVVTEENIKAALTIAKNYYLLSVTECSKTKSHIIRLSNTVLQVISLTFEFADNNNNTNEMISFLELLLDVYMKNNDNVSTELLKYGHAKIIAEKAVAVGYLRLKEYKKQIDEIGKYYK